MILRRISQHVRDQNWTAVAIDFIIVVVGPSCKDQIWSAKVAEQQLQSIQQCKYKFVVVEPHSTEYGYISCGIFS